VKSAASVPTRTAIGKCASSVAEAHCTPSVHVERTADEEPIQGALLVAERVGLVIALMLKNVV
jgi:hypothetical protein